MSSETENLLEEENCTGNLLRNRNNMEAQAEHAKSKRYNTLYTIVTILGVLMIILTYVWLEKYLGGFSLSKPSTEFNWHPLLMVTGMVFLYSQSILVYRTGRNMKKQKAKYIHAGLHITIFVLYAIAAKAVFDSHNYATPPIPNFYSLHSWLGVTTFALFCCQLIVGFTSFLFPGASKNFRATILPYHVILGSTGFIMALITALLGFSEKVIFFLGSDYQSLPPSGTILNLIGIITVVFGVLTIHLVNDKSYKREEISADELASME